jgi:hypothetical protein
MNNTNIFTFQELSVKIDEIKSLFLFFKKRRSIKLIKKVIIPTCGSEGDIYYWNQILYIFENL